MRTIYIDSDFKCHTSNDSTMTAVETDFFDGKCDAFVKGYCFVPFGSEWTRPDGAIFEGEMIAPWKPYSELNEAQRNYEKQLLQEIQNENEILKSQQEELNESYSEGVNSI